VLSKLAPTAGLVELQDTPFFPQRDYYCGPAALATVISASGQPVTAAQLVDKVYIPEKKGSLQVELLAATRRYQRLPYVIEPSISALLAEIGSGRPVLVFQNLGIRSYPVWHYAVVIGFDTERDEIILRSGTTERRVMSTRKFLKTWERSGQWGFVALNPGRLPVSPDPYRYLKAAAAMEGVALPQDLVLIFQAAANQWPQSDGALFGLGNAYYSLNKLKEAETTYRQLLEQHPQHVAARNNLAHVLSEIGCYDQAKAEVNDALTRMEPGDALREVLSETYEEILTATANRAQPETTCPAH